MARKLLTALVLAAVCYAATVAVVSLMDPWRARDESPPTAAVEPMSKIVAHAR
jgi:hypothetical protein